MFPEWIETERSIRERHSRDAVDVLDCRHHLDADDENAREEYFQTTGRLDEEAGDATEAPTAEADCTDCEQFPRVPKRFRPAGHRR